MIYISFVVLTGLKVLPASLCAFLTLSVIFMVVEVAHNDYLRIRLNIAAENHRHK